MDSNLADHDLRVAIDVLYEIGKAVRSGEGIVVNRRRQGFSDRDRAVLELIRPHLANLYRLGVAIDRAKQAPTHADKATQIAAARLTARERDVLVWLAAGKTNRDIAAILGAKPRTVEKHLEHIYEKLGVETRTAAVMRMFDQQASRPLAPMPS
jgi:DNA-binding CsgD family transcriptional regulator